MATVGAHAVKKPMSQLEPSAASSRPAARRRGVDQSALVPLAIEAIFCPEDVADPFDTVEWELRVAAIKGEGGEVLFEQSNCEIPASWSQLATNVVVSKYFYGEVNTPEREHSVRQLITRVCRTIADWGLEDGYFASAEDAERFYRELCWLCLHQYGAFNSPVWFNVGLYHVYGVRGSQCNWHWNPASESVEQPENPYEYPQGSACFIQSVRDDMEDIMELARSEAMLFKFGSGTGTDLSTLRSHREKLSGGGKPSGPLSFMRVYDQIAAVVKSGGKTRRAAKMQSLKVWHPDIMEFIECKAKEERKARLLIEKGGYEANFNGEAYSSILFQNANLSVRVTDEFMQSAVENKPWTTHWVTDPDRSGPSWPARDVLAKMAECAWSCGDPGVQYDTTINRWNTCPNSGRINASNPCSEYMFLDDTACNLASINLMKFRRRRRHVRRGRLPRCLPHLLRRPGNPGRPCQLSDEADRREQPSLPPAGPGLLEPGQPDHGQRAGVRFAGAARLVRRDHGAVARLGQPYQHRVGRGRRPVRRLCREPRADAAGDADAPRRGRGDRRGLPARTCASGPRRLGPGARKRPPPRIPQRASHGAGADRYDQLPDGLRHHGHRARHRAGEVQATGRRRHVEDRQPDGALGPEERWATTSRGSSRSWLTSTAKTRSRGRRS